MKIYLAGKFTAQKRLKFLIPYLAEFGLDVNSSWLHEPEGADPTMYAKIDMAEITLAEMLIVDTIDNSDTGGREVEFGIALAQGKKTIVIGIKRNVFHSLATEHYYTWEEFFNARKESQTNSRVGSRHRVYGQYAPTERNSMEPISLGSPTLEEDIKAQNKNRDSAYIQRTK